jgi:hypothetical protein
MKEQAIQIDLTPKQQEQLKKATGREVRAVKLSLEPLEQRVEPKLVAN